MRTELGMNGPIDIWQNQPTEVFKMSADQLQQRALEGQKKARSQARRDMLAGLLLFVFFGWAFVRFHPGYQTIGLGSPGLWCMRLGWAVLSVWCIHLAYRSYSSMRASRLFPGAPINTTLQFYKIQLEKHRNFNQHVWLTLIPAFLGIAMIVIPTLVRDIVLTPRLLTELAPLFALLALWFAIFVPQRRRRQRRLQQEIEQLSVFEREYQP